MTAVLLFRRRLFDEIGLLDEVFESYMEDIDFGLRCARSPGAQEFMSRAQFARHRGSATAGEVE